MVAILAATMLLLFRNLSWQDVKQTILSARPAYLLAGFGMMMVYQLCIALSIRTLIRTFTGGHCSLGLSATAAFIGFYFNNITPSASGGQPMEMYYLNRRGINLSHSSMIFILLAIFYNITIIGAALIMLVWRYDLISATAKTNIPIPPNQWVKLLQKSVDLGKISTLSSTDGRASCRERV